MSERQERSCPECAEPVPAASRRCSHCGLWLGSASMEPAPSRAPRWMLLVVPVAVAAGIAAGLYGKSVSSADSAHQWMGHFASSTFTPADDGSTRQVTRSLRVNRDGIRFEEIGTASGSDGQVTIRVRCRSGTVDSEMATSVVPTKCFVSRTAWADSAQLPVGAWDWFKYNETNDAWESRTAEGAFRLSRVTQSDGGAKLQEEEVASNSRAKSGHPNLARTERMWRVSFR